MATADAERRHPVWAGFLLGVVATIVWFFVIAYGTDLHNYEFFNAVAIGSGCLLAGGLLLTLTKRTRLLGIGLAVGAPVAFVVEQVVLVLLLMNALS